MITIYHYARCSKSRNALCILEDKKVGFETRFYLENPLTTDELKKLHKKLGRPFLDMVRTGEPIYKELFSGKEPTEQELIEAVAQHPVLLQRPIVEKEDSAIIARPPVNLEDYLAE